MGCAILAMVLANSGLAALYETVLHTKVSLHLGELQLSHTIHHWINDGLMALFFFVIWAGCGHPCRISCSAAGYGS